VEENRGAQESDGCEAHRVDVRAGDVSNSSGSPGDSSSLSATSPLFAFFGHLALASTEAEVIETIINQGVPVIGASSATLALLTEDASQLRLAAVYGQQIEPLSRTPAIPISAPVPLAQAAANGVPLWFARSEDLAARFPAVAPEVLGQPCSLAYLPLQADDQLWGVLSLRFAAARAFEPDERDQLLMAADFFGTALQHARMLEQLDVAEQQQNEVLAIVAHELRNPLTGITGYLQLLAQQLSHDPIDRQRALASVQQILSQSRRLEQLLGSLLDRSRIQQGLLSLEITPCDLSALVRDCVERFMASSEWTPNHELVLDLMPELPGRWDRLRIEQVVTNLLSNAVKYSPAGGHVTIVDRELGDLVELTIADEGVGIPPEDQGHLFEPFMRSGGLGSRVPGIGLGLHIVATIVEQHQGAVAVESTPGAGTSVTVLLPRNPLDSPLA
jgi:signal transduction histidine kinase